MTTLCLLFDSSYEYLGDLFVSGGKFSSAALTKHGEDRIGDDLGSWQEEGIPVRVEVFGSKDHPKDITFGTERIKPSDERFGVALRQWADDHHFLVLSMKSDAISCWEMLLRLPFKGAERFAFALAISKATRPQLERWRDDLQKALEVHEEGERMILERVKAMRTKTIKKLTY
jgi:hypothetical protein